MINGGFMRVAIDRWGLIERMDDGLKGFDNDINYKNNLSEVQYQLVRGDRDRNSGNRDKDRAAERNKVQQRK